MGMAAEAGDLEPRQITELQQIFLRRDLDPGAADGSLRATLGLGQGGCHIQGQRIVHEEVAAPDLGSSAVQGDVPILGRLCPEAEEATKTPMAPLQAVSCCWPMFPRLPQLSSWPWRPGLAGHAPVPLTLAKPVLGSCPVPVL